MTLGDGLAREAGELRLDSLYDNGEEAGVVLQVV